MLKLLLYSKHGSLMRSFAIQQAMLLVFGLLFAFASLFYVRMLEHRAEIAKLKNEISLAIERKSDQLRAWHSLGLSEAVEQEVLLLKKTYAITNLRFLSKSELPLSLLPNEIQIPSVGEPDLDVYIITQFQGTNTITQTFNNPNTYISFIAILLLVVGNIMLGTKFFSMRVINPLTKLKGELSNPDKKTNLSNPDKDQGEISEFIDDIIRITTENYKFQSERDAYQTQAALGSQAAQVSHDIRSPLSALNMILGQLTQIPEHQRMVIRSSVNRINDIANTLLQKSKEQNNLTTITKSDLKGKTKFEVELLPALLDTLVSEKRVQFRDKLGIEIEVDFKESYGTFAKIDSTELKRIISNLVNNSVDAFFEGKGRVTVSVVRKEENVVINIQDNGKGIPAHILAKLGELGVTHGKEGTESGSGLGVYHAKKTIESFGGKFEIKSQLEIGTNIQLILPSAPAPKWFVEKLNISLNTKVIALDDDASIHGIWKGRFESTSTIKDEKIFLLSFTSGSEFKTWFSTNNSNDVLFLFDYELLAQPQTGLDIIEELGIGNKSILITSRYEEPQLRNRCEKLEVKLIPKGMASLIPIVIEKPKELFHLALIDDDIDLVQATWRIMANIKGLSIKMFTTPQEFFAAAESIDRQTPIYVDVSLGNGIKGTDVAKEIFKLGFVEINLATGYDVNSIDVPSFISKTVGKDFPIA